MQAAIPRFIIAILAIIIPISIAAAAEWVRPTEVDSLPVWGLQQGLQFAIFPGGFTDGDGGPRGLIRVGYPTLPNGRHDLINFIAIEPIVGTSRGYSEMERSQLDGRQGKRFWTAPPQDSDDPVPIHHAAEISSPAPGVEQLTVSLRMEKFENGAHVRLELSQRSDLPGELRIVVHKEAGSAPISACILTATMGNKTRSRILWLQDQSVSSHQIFDNYNGPDFTPHKIYPLAELSRNSAEDAIVAITTDEDQPSATAGQPAWWRYRGEKVTQYWRKPAVGVNDSLRCAVNGRFTYWKSRNPIPGGLSFENFELIEDFSDGAEMIFGITKIAAETLLAQP